VSWVVRRPIRTSTAVSIRLQKPPEIAEPARAALVAAVHAVHAVVRGCRFRTLPWTHPATT
jgi:hypothetical protein